MSREMPHDCHTNALPWPALALHPRSGRREKVGPSADLASVSSHASSGSGPSTFSVPPSGSSSKLAAKALAAANASQPVHLR